MLGFRSVVEDFASTMDALRDFGTSVRPVLLQRQKRVAETAEKMLRPLATAILLVEGDLDVLADEIKKPILDFRKVMAELSPEKHADVQDQIRKFASIKIIDGKIQVDLDEPIAKHVMAQQAGS